MSTIPATKGVLIIAGSQPSFSKINGKIEPVNVPQITIKRSVKGTTNIVRFINPTSSGTKNDVAK